MPLALAHVPPSSASAAGGHAPSPLPIATQHTNHPSTLLPHVGCLPAPAVQQAAPRCQISPTCCNTGLATGATNRLKSPSRLPAVQAMWRLSCARRRTSRLQQVAPVWEAHLGHNTKPHAGRIHIHHKQQGPGVTPARKRDSCGMSPKQHAAGSGSGQPGHMWSSRQRVGCVGRPSWAMVCAGCTQSVGRACCCRGTYPPAGVLTSHMS